MARIIISTQAAQDLRDIWHYIDANRGEKRATQVLLQLRQKLTILAEQPGIGRTRHELRTGLRSHPVGSYIIFYFPMTDGIEVVRVLHGRRDIDRVFEEEEPEADA